jgi:hypothetical protein
MENLLMSFASNKIGIGNASRPSGEWKKSPIVCQLTTLSLRSFAIRFLVSRACRVGLF